MANIFDLDFDQDGDRDGYLTHRALLSRQAGAERLGASVWELPAGQTAYAYHFHLRQEEMLFVLAGCPSLRTPVGWRELQEGEVVAFPAGERGAHQLVNRSAATTRVLVVSTGEAPEVLVQPDSDKVGVYEERPEGERVAFYRREDAVGYFEGETPPSA